MTCCNCLNPYTEKSFCDFKTRTSVPIIELISLRQYEQKYANFMKGQLENGTSHCDHLLHTKRDVDTILWIFPKRNWIETILSGIYEWKAKFIKFGWTLLTAGVVSVICKCCCHRMQFWVCGERVLRSEEEAGSLSRVFCLGRRLALLTKVSLVANHASLRGDYSKEVLVLDHTPNSYLIQCIILTGWCQEPNVIWLSQFIHQLSC